MPRKRHLDTPVQWFINIPKTLAAKVELLLADPLQPDRARYGSRSALVQQLLREWIEKRAKEMPIDNSKPPVV